MFTAIKLQNKIPHPWWHNFLGFCRLSSWSTDNSWFIFTCHKCKKKYHMYSEEEHYQRVDL